MEIIQLNYPLDLKQLNTEPKIFALGFFDGVHLGHQEVIKNAIKIGQERHLPVALMTFDKYPGIIFRQIKADDFEYLTTIERKAELLRELGVDLMYVINFTSTVGHLQPQQFVNQFLVNLGAQVVVAGFDYTYGPKKIADMTLLPKYAANRFEVVTIPEQKKFTTKISSSAIRTALSQGDVDRANELLGYVYQTDGIVVHGEARGRTLGYPTANIKTTDSERLPTIGIYATEILVQGQWYPSMTSVGRNVTFGADRPVTIEVNIFDFHDDIYGETIKLRWHHWLRGEEKFADAQALVDQLAQDEADTRIYFTETDGC